MSARLDGSETCEPMRRRHTLRSHLSLKFSLQRADKGYMMNAWDRPRLGRPLYHTAQALAHYHATEPAREAAREAILDGPNNFDDRAYFGPAERAWEVVQHAFWNDTRDCNSRDHAALVDYHIICHWVTGGCSANYWCGRGEKGLMFRA